VVDDGAHGRHLQTRSSWWLTLHLYLILDEGIARVVSRPWHQLACAAAHPSVWNQPISVDRSNDVIGPALRESGGLNDGIARKG
jgi:hypothetical protein